jgi:hypothetical protein
LEGNETSLIGIVVDQSALHGILAKINDLGLSLISVNKLPSKRPAVYHEREFKES